MATQKLERTEWRAFLDGVSKLLDAKEAEIEVGSLRLGEQVQAKWLPVIGVTYDPGDDLVEVALEGLDHMIHKPREIYVEMGAGKLTSIEIIEAGGTKQIVKFRDQLLLPPPGR